MRAAIISTIFILSVSSAYASTFTALGASNDTDSLFFQSKGAMEMPFADMKVSPLVVPMWGAEKLNRVMQIEPALPVGHAGALFAVSDGAASDIINFVSNPVQRQKEALIAKGFAISASNRSSVRKVPTPTAFFVLMTALAASFIPRSVRSYRAPRRYTRISV